MQNCYFSVSQTTQAGRTPLGHQEHAHSRDFRPRVQKGMYAEPELQSVNQTTDLDYDAIVPPMEAKVQLSLMRIVVCFCCRTVWRMRDVVSDWVDCGACR